MSPSSQLIALELYPEGASVPLPAVMRPVAVADRKSPESPQSPPPLALEGACGVLQAAGAFDHGSQPPAAAAAPHMLAIHHVLATVSHPSLAVVQLLLQMNRTAACTATFGSNLPLHLAAAQGAPTAFMRELLQAYPQACAHQNSRGELPLHLYLRAGGADPALILSMLEAHPGAVDVAAANGRLPLHEALNSEAACQVPGAVIPLITPTSASRPEQRLAIAANPPTATNTPKAFLAPKPQHWPPPSGPPRAPRRARRGGATTDLLPLHLAVLNLAAPTIVAALLKQYPAAQAVRASAQRLTPLMTAISRWNIVPRDVVLQLITPLAASRTDRRGNSALHMALRSHLPMDLTLALLRVFPAAAGHANNLGVLPLHQAIMSVSAPAVVEALVASNPGACTRITDCFATHLMPRFALQMLIDILISRHAERPSVAPPDPFTHRLATFTPSLIEAIYAASPERLQATTLRKVQDFAAAHHMHIKKKSPAASISTSAPKLQLAAVGRRKPCIDATKRMALWEWLVDTYARNHRVQSGSDINDGVDGDGDINTDDGASMRNSSREKLELDFEQPDVRDVPDVDIPDINGRDVGRDVHVDVDVLAGRVEGAEFFEPKSALDLQPNQNPYPNRPLLAVMSDRVRRSRGSSSATTCSNSTANTDIVRLELEDSDHEELDV